MATVIATTVRPVLGPPFPVGVQRRWQDGLSRLTARPRGVVRDRVVLGGRPALRLDPPDRQPGCAVLWLHGGAFVTGSFATHGSFAAALARAAGVRVYLLDYRLAPEHGHPAAVDDALAALGYVPEERVVLGGDSAGGCLALLTALAQTRALDGLALVSPVVDATGRTARTWSGRDALLRRSWVEGGTRDYFGDEVPDLLEADLNGLPPTVVHVSEHERLRPEGEQLAARTGAELVLLDGLWHDAHLQCDSVREAADAVARLGASVRAFLA
jgi:acetyl esterase/lipase